MDQVVVEGLKAIFKRINLSTGFVHPDDKGSTIEMLRRLKKAGYLLDPDQIRNWGYLKGLHSKHADDLKNFVIGVNADKRYQIGKMPHWKENIIEVLKQKA